MKKVFKVFGEDGHRQRESFRPSMDIGWLKVLASDVTGTNDYVILEIEKDTEEEIYERLFGQLSDGVFENSRYGKILLEDGRTFNFGSDVGTDDYSVEETENSVIVWNLKRTTS